MSDKQINKQTNKQTNTCIFPLLSQFLSCTSSLSVTTRWFRLVNVVLVDANRDGDAGEGEQEQDDDDEQ